MSDLNDPITLKLQRRHARQQGLFAPAQIKAALLQAVKMLLPQRMAHSPVMFITEIGATLTTLITIQSMIQNANEWWYHAVISGILWITVLFANFAEALAEARGKAQANTLRQSRQETLARRYRDGQEELIPSSQLRKGDKVKIGVGQMIPSDGEVIQGIASVDESAITGESAPVIREAGGDRSGVTGGTRVLSDEILMEITTNVGESFMDRMIALVEGAQRQKTPNEIALTIVLAGITLGFLIVTVALFPMGLFFGVQLDTPTLIALLVCLIPTTIGSLLPAIGLAGMNRAMSANVLAK
ncbi:MAG: potassium transporter KtrB, partial [Beggiatoa sp. IS2]